MTTTYGVLLDYQLCDIKHTAMENYELLKNHLEATGEYLQKPATPLFIKPEERVFHESIESKTKSEIFSIIEEQ